MIKNRISHIWNFLTGHVMAKTRNLQEVQEERRLIAQRMAQMSNHDNLVETDMDQYMRRADEMMANANRALDHALASLPDIHTDVHAIHDVRTTLTRRASHLMPRSEDYPYPANHQPTAEVHSHTPTADIKPETPPDYKPEPRSEVIDDDEEI